MVMDLPSPQNVGREFVRQYYTMLHEAPDYLYRFYSHNSSFLHGGVDHLDEEQLPAVGQSEINKRISSLKFRDCHAKIRQVDSQWSIGGSVVIQVAGELSNNGLPMRRFTQTFVLGQQNPKKYYVHNDIFRYQDVVFAEPGNENEIANEAGDVEVLERIEEDHQPLGAQDGESGNVYYGDETEAIQAPVNQVSNGTRVDIEVAEEESNSKPDDSIEALVNVESQAAAAETIEEVKMGGEPVVDAVVEDDGSGEIPVAKKEVGEETEEQRKAQESEDTAVPQKPTWAAMASKNPTTPIAANASAAPGAGGMPKPQAAVRPEMKNENSAVAGLPQRAPRGPKTEPIPQENYRSGVDSGDDTGRSIGIQYPDNQQVFVGNLPRNLADKDLREFFEKFGGVLDMRINRKPNNNNLPNFGFVVFDSPKTVEKVLSERPLMFNGKHRVNVEEKKPREELVAARPRSATHIVGKPAAGRGGAEMNPAGRGAGRLNVPGSGGARSYAKGNIIDESKPTAR